MDQGRILLRLRIMNTDMGISSNAPAAAMMGTALGKASRREHSRPCLLPDRAEVYRIDIRSDGDCIPGLVVGFSVLLVGPSLESVSGTGGSLAGDGVMVARMLLGVPRHACSLA